MDCTVLGAVAELGRSLIAERVRAGLRDARARGKRLGCPRVIVDAARMGRLRSQGLSRAKIAAEVGIGEGTVYRLAQTCTKTRAILSAVILSMCCFVLVWSQSKDESPLRPESPNRPAA
jgi:DNA invertase Pin-like site-specific DNA recombinase